MLELYLLKLYLKWSIIVSTIIMIILVMASLCCAEPQYTDEEIVNAIYLAEGENATYLYGIRSIKYDTPGEARKICFNTVRNQRRRHKAHTCGFSYLQCLQRRYCPTEGATNDPQGLNKNWLSNVRFFLEKGR